MKRRSLIEGNKMKILQINTVYKQGSTGKIAYQIQQLVNSKGGNCIVAYRYAESHDEKENIYEISTWLDCHIHNRLAKITLLQGVWSISRTRKFIKFIKGFDPDIIHIHNIHGSYVNHPMLFSFLRNANIPIVWTLHDCWSITGQCAYFDMLKCDKWKTGCRSCKLHMDRLLNIVNIPNIMWNFKRKWFNRVHNMILITPSQWLADLIKQSYLQDYPVKIINNGIDLQVFKPTPSDFRKKLCIKNRFIVLGVAFDWGKRKGLDVFIELSKRLNSNRYKIVLIGTDDRVDELLPSNIISIHRTRNQVELAAIYTAADVFVNPTREDNYPTVNMESLACGTPVLTYRTGGSPEIIDETCGAIIDCDDIDTMEKEIMRICEDKLYSEAACLQRARRFDSNQRNEEYIELYENCACSSKCSL